MKTSSSCTKCGAKEIGATTSPAERKIAGHTFKADLPATKCGACGEVLIDGPGFEAFDLSAALELARAGISAPEALRFMRGALGLRAADLADLLDLTPETVSRVENGRAPPDKRTVGLLAAMLEDRGAGSTRTVDQLRAQRYPHKLKGTVRLSPTAHTSSGRRARG